jgi:hypothetical protein
VNERARSRATRLLRTLITTGLCAALAACAREPAPPFELALGVRSDTGAPVAGARVSIAGEPAGISDAEGRIAVAVRGAEGDRLELGLECPPGFAAAAEPGVLILRRVRPLSGGEPSPLAHALRCKPAARAAVVLVHVQGARSVPVTLDGERVATTDDHGFAHVYVSRAPGARFELTLDTTSARELMPRSPRRSFELDDADALFVFDQRFEPRKRAASSAPKPAAPPPPTRLR